MIHKFLLRFYGPRAEINGADCYAKMAKTFPEIVGASKGMLSTSVNPLVSKTDCEITLKFANAADRDRVHADPRGRVIYMKYASEGHEGATFVTRKPGDPGGMAALLNTPAVRRAQAVGAVQAVVPVRLRGIRPAIAQAGLGRDAVEGLSQDNPKRPRNRG